MREEGKRSQGAERSAGYQAQPVNLYPLRGTHWRGGLTAGQTRKRILALSDLLAGPLAAERLTCRRPPCQRVPRRGRGVGRPRTCRFLWLVASSILPPLLALAGVAELVDAADSKSAMGN